MTFLKRQGGSFAVLSVCMVVALSSAFLFGNSNATDSNNLKDAAQYSAYASHIDQGLGYTDGTAAFNAWREPGYPLFLSVVYALFGNQNYAAVALIQGLLIGCAGFIVFCLFDKSRMRRVGIATALLVSALPSYGYYDNETMTEMFSVFLYALILYLALRVLRAKDTPWGTLLLFGLVCGVATLTRVQFIFFLPGALICYALYAWWHTESWKRVAFCALVPLAVYALMLGTWAVYVQEHTGTFELVAPNREQESIYYRAARAELSYGELTQYLAAWVRRQSTPGYPSATILDQYDFKGLRPAYLAEATTSQAAASIERDNLHTILKHPGEYLYSNIIEVIKLTFVEEIGLPSYIRAGEYIVLYALFIFGLIQLLYRRGAEETRQIAYLALLFILYNCAVVSFFDAIPRYNTPILFLYLVVGSVGVGLWLERRKNLEGSAEKTA
jgi:4-amino-4-deoxy-L-arabinose transferase-like glycosyltransferase